MRGLAYRFVIRDYSIRKAGGERSEGGNVGHLVQPPPGKGGERIENIITGSSIEPEGKHEEGNP